ncbi:hypothetical protein [Mycobacteroides abscessus]|uniref:hypothetical protein n=1 Tax=Mycobacteroides abscessus TaxID=36809 RepID=UPI001F25DF2A|nr:hypothetical protein [Mycobacteroides abscessus]
MQIILGKVRPFLRRLAEAHPQVLIIAPADAIDRLQKVVDDADNLRVKGSTNQPVAMPELAELRQYRALKASLLKNLALPDTEELMASKADHLTDVRRAAASARFTKGA